MQPPAVPRNLRRLRHEKGNTCPTIQRERTARQATPPAAPVLTPQTAHKTGKITPQTHPENHRLATLVPPLCGQPTQARKTALAEAPAVTATAVTATAEETAAVEVAAVVADVVVEAVAKRAEHLLASLRDLNLRARGTTTPRATQVTTLVAAKVAGSHVAVGAEVAAAAAETTAVTTTAVRVPRPSRSPHSPVLR